MADGSDRHDNVPEPTGGAVKPQETERSLIGMYYSRLLKKVGDTIIEVESLSRWIDRGQALPDLKDELRHCYRNSRTKWLDEYKQRKEPIKPSEPTNSVYNTCQLYTTSYDSAVSTQDINSFRVQFERLDDCVLRLKSRARSMLSVNEFPTSGDQDESN